MVSCSLILGMLILLLALAIPFLPSLLYDKPLYPSNHLEAIAFGTEPTTVLVTGADTEFGIAIVQALMKHHKSLEKEASTLTIALGCSRNDCHRAILEGQSSNNVLLIPFILDLHSKTSIEQAAVRLQHDLPKPPDVLVPQLHLVIYGTAPPPSETDQAPFILRQHYLGHALLTHHLWKNIKAVQDRNSKRKARLVVVSTPLAVLPIDPEPLGTGPNAGMEWIPSTTPEVETSFMEQHYNPWIYYIRAKRAQLFFLAELQRQYPHFITTAACHSTPDSVLMAAQHEAACYVGPQWLFLGGPAALVSRAANLYEGSAHHAAFDPVAASEYFDQTIQALRIAKFGAKSYVTM